MPTAQEPNATVSRTLPAPEQIQTSAETNGPSRIALLDRVHTFWRQFSVSPFLFDISTFARIVRGEVRSCYNRICVLSASRVRWGRGLSVGLDLGPLFESGPDESLQPCCATHARSSCIECISAKYPWLSDGDDLLILEGWELGRKFGVGTARTSGKSTEGP
jgi:hypothetical protein